jgi:hypothetical protein
MNIIVLEIQKDEEGYYVDTLIGNEIQSIFLHELGYKNDIGKAILEKELDPLLNKNIGLCLGAIRQLAFKKKSYVEDLIKILVNKNIACIHKNKEFCFAAGGK